MNKKYNVVVWGDKEQYDSYINQIKHEELKGNICVLGIVKDDIGSRESLDGYRYIEKDELENLDVDCVLITAVNFHINVVKGEVNSLLPDIPVISIKVFNIPLFDMRRYMSILEKRPTIIANSCWGGG